MELHGCDEKKTVSFRPFKKTWNTFEQTSDCCPPSVGCNFVLGPWNALGRPANAACWRRGSAQGRKCKQSFCWQIFPCLHSFIVSVQPYLFDKHP